MAVTSETVNKTNKHPSGRFMTACIWLSDLADSQKQIITGMYPVVPIGLVMQATVATVTGSVSQWFEFGREFYKTELIQLQS